MKTFEEYGYVIKGGVLAFQKGPLSQWWGGKKIEAGKSDFVWNGLKYNCTEQFMMAGKARLFKDWESLDKIMHTASPSKQKDLGRKVSGYDQKVWDGNKFSIVVQGNALKFSQNPELEDFLLSTKGLVLVEAAPWDKVWGVGTGPEDSSTFDPDEWQGENLLGKALMETRGILSNIKGIQPTTSV